MEIERSFEEYSENLICEDQGMNYITLFTDFLTDHFIDLTDDEVGKITRAALNYVLTGEEPEYEPRSVLSLSWRRIKRHVDQSIAKSEKNRANATNSKRTKANASETKRPKANESEQKRTEAKASDSIHEYEYEQEQEYEYEQEYEQEQEQEYEQNNKVITVKRAQARRFTPPTLEEVKAYCEERGNSVDPQRFINHYSSNGWKVGKNPMKDWHAAVRTWEGNEYTSGRSSPPDDTGVRYGQVYRSRKVDNDCYTSLDDADEHGRLPGEPGYGT